LRGKKQGLPDRFPSPPKNFDQTVLPWRPVKCTNRPPNAGMAALLGDSHDIQAR
jgi:hypothetical protein